MAHSSSWKAEERRIAALLQTQRNPSNGRRQNDIDAGKFAIECKKRKDIPEWLRHALHQAREGAIKAAQRQLPIVVLSDARGIGYPIKRYVLMDFDVFLALRDGDAVYSGSETQEARTGVADG